VPLAIPLFLESIFNNLINTANTAVLSGYSEEAVVATGTVSIICSLFLTFFSSIAIGSSVIISNEIGADELEKAERANGSSIVLCGLLGAAVTMILLCGAPLIARWMNLTGEVYNLAVTYLRTLSFGQFFLAIQTVMLYIMRCYGYPKAAVITGIIKNLCNLACSYYAVYHATHPFLSGVSGVALGTVASQLLGLLIICGMFVRYKIRVRREKTIPSLFGQMRRILSIGIPACVSGASFTISQIITNAFVVLIGLEAASAKVYFASILGYTHLFSGSVGNANALLVGRLFGAQRYEHAERLNRMLVRYTILGNLSVSLAVFLLRRPILSLFTDSTVIVQMAFGIFLVDLVIEQARAISQIYEYALRATGDVTPTMIVTLISGWVFSVGLAYVLSIPCGMGLIGCWIGLAIDESIRTIYTFWRWKARKWIPKESRLTADEVR